MQIIPVILSGGSGVRLWPLSRREYPKQYLPLVGEHTMLQETIMRLNGIENLGDPIIICNAEHRFLVGEQCQQVNVNSPTILLEPVGRNTAPAIAAAAFQSLKISNNSLLLVLSADHIIQEIDAFYQTINIACIHALEGKLVTFGIRPTNANTDYGYIKYSKEDVNGSFKAEEFIEKPNKEKAKTFLKKSNYFWNSGIFMFRSDAIINELSVHAPDIVRLVNDAVNDATKDLDFIRLDKKAFESSPSDSIDYALMEKSKNVVVIPLDAGWSDIGSWSALYEISEKDRNGNVLKGDVIIQDTTNTYIYAYHHIVTAVGLENLLVVDTPDATFISTQDKANDVKSIVKSLEKKGRDEAYSNRKVHRPWGWYDIIQSGKYFQVKRLHVSPGAKLSLQKHNKRAEHWVILSGEAEVNNNGNILSLSAGESTHIPAGTIHSLENKKNEPLEIIEVQSGRYLGEDDIIRLEDIYGRLGR